MPAGDRPLLAWASDHHTFPLPETHPFPVAKYTRVRERLLAERVIGGDPLFASMDITVRRNAYGRQVDSFEADVDVSAYLDVKVWPLGQLTDSSFYVDDLFIGVAP